MARLRPTLEFRRGDELAAHVVATADAIWFDGHFPDGPLLPGVAMLALIEETIERFWPASEGPALRVRSYRRVRFRQRVRPGTNLHLHVRDAGSGRLRFSVEVAGQAACTGECEVTELDRATAPAHVDPTAFESLIDENDRRLCSDGTTVAMVMSRALALCDLRVRSGRPRVCVATEDRLDVAAALLAAFSGEIEVVLPPALAPEAVRAVCEARPLSHWLGPAEWGPALRDLSIPHVTLDGLTPAHRALRMGNGDRPCVFLPTGGTTGAPRLWPKSRDNLVCEALAHARALQIGPGDHILATVPPHHIYGLLFSVLLPLASGATVERRSPFYPQEIAQRIRQTAATILVSTPAHLRALTAALGPSPELRLVLSSAAPLTATDAAAFAERTGHWPLEIYGSTETGGIATRRQDRAQAPWQPLTAVNCRTEDGTLAVRSPYLSVQAVEAGGFFVTADRVHLHEDGSFELLGRSDGIVKVGGQRVDLPDVENVLRSLVEVEDAAVVALPLDSGRGHEIAALLVSPRPLDDIARELRERLPPPAWPRRLRGVPEIPITPAGKRDRTAILRLLEIAGSHEGSGG